MVAHAKLSASGSHRWMACPGSIALEATMPEPPDSPYAAEGTAAHALADKCLREGHDTAGYIGTTFEGQIVVQEMIDAVQIYLDYVRSQPGKLFPERRVNFSDWVPDGFGTSDAIVLHEGMLTVIDLKYGRGVRVDAEENSQLMLYALGALAEFDFLYEFDRFRLVVVQPRIDHISEWEIGKTELLGWGETVKIAAGAALAENAPFVPDEDACRFCKGKSVCTALATFALDTAMEGFAPTFKDPLKLSPEEVADLLGKLDLFINWAKALEGHAQSELEQGRTIPGYKLVEGKSNRKWGDEEKVAAFLLGRLAEADVYARSLVSPAQAEKLLGGKKTAAELLEPYIVKPPGKPTLALSSDPRPAIDVDIYAGFETPEAA